MKCNNCSEIFEIICKDQERRSILCPRCNSKDIETLISKSSFILKGNCWAKDGYSHSK